MKLTSIAFMILLFGCIGCKNNVKMKSETTKADYVISLNEQFEIELASNPTTGYQWQWINRNDIQIIDSLAVEFLPDTPILIGSGGKEVWKFRGVKVGVDTIKMAYRRPWEAASSEGEKLITVQVK